MKTLFVGLVVLSAVAGVARGHAQGTSAAPGTGNQSGQKIAQTSTSVAIQVETCRQNVLQLTEKSKGERAALAKLRTERKTLGVSGGEVVRYKLANLDQEIKEHSRQHQALITQIETENKRCEALAGKPAAVNRGPQGQPPGRKH